MIGIVDVHENAKIWAESEGEGKGCTFFVRIPVHTHSALHVTTSTLALVFDNSDGPITPLLSDPIHEFTQVELIPELCQLVVTTVPVISCVSENGSKKSPSLPLPTAPLVPAPVWKPTILVVDDSSMNRKVNP